MAAVAGSDTNRSVHGLESRHHGARLRYPQPGGTRHSTLRPCMHSAQITLASITGWVRSLACLETLSRPPSPHNRAGRSAAVRCRPRCARPAGSRSIPATAAPGIQHSDPPRRPVPGWLACGPPADLSRQSRCPNANILASAVLSIIINYGNDPLSIPGGLRFTSLQRESFTTRASKIFRSRLRLPRRERSRVAPPARFFVDG